jgi:hypothetical protein
MFSYPPCRIPPARDSSTLARSPSGLTHDTVLHEIVSVCT